MNSLPSQCKEIVRQEASHLGIYRTGFTQASMVNKTIVKSYRKWIDNGTHGEMNYLERYDDLRADPRLLLPAAQSIIVCAASYHSSLKMPSNVPQIASYALGRDYHEVMRERLTKLAQFIKKNWGGETRVCVDTAPIFEKYWATKAGIGFIGMNSLLIVPGAGSYVFIGEILTTLRFPKDKPEKATCMRCGACVKACPAQAIRKDGSVDARRCLSYLTIEYHGDFPKGTNLGNRLYGCDTCQQVCPHNKDIIETPIVDLRPRKEILSLTSNDVATMSQEQFSTLFQHSAIKRTKLTGLKRNLRSVKKGKTKDSTLQ